MRLLGILVRLANKYRICRNYYAEVWVRHADWKEAEFFDELPAHLRGEVAAFLMEEVFDQSDFFRWVVDHVVSCQLCSCVSI